MRLAKSTAAAGALIAALTSGQAFAVIETFDVWAGLTNPDIDDPAIVDDPDDFGGLTETDKTITFINSGATVTTQATPKDNTVRSADTDFNETPVEFEVAFTVDNVNNRHVVQFQKEDGSVVNLAGLDAGDVLAVQYVINIDPSDYPAEPDQERFGQVFLGLQVNGSFGGVSVAKRIQGLTPFGLDASDVAWDVNSNFAVGTFFDRTIETDDATDADVFCGICTTFLVTDFVTLINAQGAPTGLLNLSNTFEQVVPVPAPLALLGAGLVGIGFVRRMKKAA